MLAVLLLAVCLVPAMNAVRYSTAAPLIAQSSAQALLCTKSQMEKVLAEPYRNLLAAANSSAKRSAVYAPATPSPAYSLSADTLCPARNAYIARYSPATDYPAADTGLLYVTVAVPDAGATPGAVMFSFSTLVSR